MQADLFSCSVCLLQFDGQAHLPKLIPTCGHTICLTCLTDIINTKRECPEDREKFPNLLKKSEDFPTNRLALQAVDIRVNGNYETCNQHSKPKHLVCFRDYVQICEECRSNHKDHNIKSLKELKDKAKVQKERLKALVEDFAIKKDSAEACIKDFRKSAATILERGFNRAREILKRREKEIFNQIDSLLETKKGEIEKAIEEDDLLKEKYNIKIDDLNDLSSSNRFFRTLDKLEKKKMNPFKIDHILNDLKQIKERYIPALKTRTDSLVSSIEKLDFDIVTKNSVSVNEMGDLNAKISNLEALLNIKTHGTKLVVTPRNSTSELLSSPLDLSLCRDITSFEIRFNEGELTLEHFHALKEVYSRCVNITAFCLQAKNKGFTDDHLIRFASDPFWAINKTKEVCFDFQSSQVSDRGLTKFITKSLANMLQVTRFYLFANQRNITDISVGALITHFTSKLINLEEFNLQIEGTKITDFSILELFKSMRHLMDKMKIFSLNLGSTQITDQILVDFSQEILSWSSNLDSLNLVLSNTRMTDHGFETFCEEAKDKLQSIKHFSLKLAGTQITDQSFSAFCNDVLPNMESLTDFEMSLPRKATDLSIKSLRGGLDKIIKNLERFKLINSNPMISRNASQMIIKLIDLKSLPCLRVFDLVLNEISVDNITRGQVNEIKKQLSLRNKEN